MPRHAGLLLPLFSAASSASWGIGELRDVGPLAAWMAGAGFDRLMLLPLGTMAAGQSSPYSAESAMAIDPIYLAVEAVEDFARAGGVTSLAAGARTALEEARAASHVSHRHVRAAKRPALEQAFEHFARHEWAHHTVRAASLAAYIAREREWLEDYALFEALAEATPVASWREWPAPLRDREPHGLDEARRQLSHEVLRQQYWQWLADGQWRAARAAARAHGVLVVGDLPFVVNTHSADVWTRQQDFLLDVSAGAPPDAFSATGQDWGLPTYRWNAIWQTDFAWLRQRARRMAALFDGCRIDHLVGLFRTYGRPAAGDPFFIPAGEPAQLRQGEAILRIFLGSGLELVAEDLGTVPDSVRAKLAEVGVPGCKVLRWERDWHAPDQPFLDPASYPARSAAMTGTHDTETLAQWWDHADTAERTAFWQVPALAARPAIDPTGPWTPERRDAVIELLYHAGSDWVFLPVQDLFGWRDRINTPATVNDRNWTWRLPWPVDRLADAAEARERASFSRRLARASDRI